MTNEIVKYYSIFLFFHVVHFCKRPSQSIFSLASNSSSLVLLCKIWGVSKSLKSFMSAPRIRKDQHQLVENSGSSKLNNHILTSIGISNINVEYSPVLWLQRNYSPTCVGPQNRNCHLPNLWICALSHYQIQQISSAIVSSSRSSLRHGALL